jgi:hypothetical protein
VDVSLVPARVTRLLAVREDEDEVEVEDEDEVEEEDKDEVEEVHLSLWRRRYPLLLAMWLSSLLGQSLLMRRWRWRRSLWTRRPSGRWLRSSCRLMGKPVSLMWPRSLLLRRGKPSSNQARKSKFNFEHVILFWS